MGAVTTAEGTASTAMGESTTAPGHNSTAMGYATTASGYRATAMGSNTTASGSYSTAMGFSSTAFGSHSTAMGHYTLAKPYASLVIGRYNDTTSLSSTSWDPLDPVFIIGNGTANNARSNAMTVLKNGKTGIGTLTPQTQLQITGGTDANYTNMGGYLVLGDHLGLNVVFDNNEIIARDNGAISDLFLQHDGGDTRLCFTAGNVSIGNISPTYQLQLSSDSGAKPTTNTWTIPSDTRLKKNVHDYEDGLEELLKIHPVWFTYTGEANMPQETGVGVLAQELKEVAPYMVGTWNHKDENGNSTPYLSVNNGAMTYMLINAVKEQQHTITDQQEKIDFLLKELRELKSLVAKVGETK